MNQLEEINASKLTPMLAQYYEIKQGAPDCILFYRMGDFYEMFFNDAVLAAPILEVQLTSRDKTAKDPIPMCGVPHHSAGAYIERLLAQGHKVAVCEQVGEPSAQKKLVERKIVRILTPALVGNPDLLPDTSTKTLIALRFVDSKTHVLVLDMMSGRVLDGVCDTWEAIEELFLLHSPSELLVESEIPQSHPIGQLIQATANLAVTYRPQYFKEGAGIEEPVRRYVLETHGEGALGMLARSVPITQSGQVQIDSAALQALEILESHSPEVKGACLFQSLDACQTSMGKRLLKYWLSHPICDELTINSRLDAVEHLHQFPLALSSIQSLLRGMRDLERLATKTALGFSRPPDLVAVRNIQVAIPQLQQILLQTACAHQVGLAEKLNPLPELTGELNRAFKDDPPPGYRDGGIFRDDFSDELASLREISRDAKRLILELEERERQRTGIGSLKIRFNRVFGYSLEITKTHLNKVPAYFIRKQTLANGERYITEELKRLEEKILSSDERLVRLEEQLFLMLREKVAAAGRVLRDNAGCLAELDVLCSFAARARERGYVRPMVHRGHRLAIIEGRHPVVEAIVPRGGFVANSVVLDDKDARTLVITGPNMAGKSTIMRQVALISIMAHCGSFVSCERAEIPVMDAIFTRIGSSDSLARGQSTFMVEMSEMSRVLKKATRRSLVLVDEIGRGTSTYDGLSLAWSLLEFLHEDVGAKTLFATHFHELTALEGTLVGLKNVSVAVDWVGEDIVFLHRLVSGACPRSYGVEVARLAGLPSKVLLRAKHILGALELQSQRGVRVRSEASKVRDKQLNFLEL